MAADHFSWVLTVFFNLHLLHTVPMNSVHDMGGMTCYGPIPIDPNEPVFPTNWERRVFALNVASLAFFGPIDRARHAVEVMDPVHYLSTSYYEHWLAGMENMGKDLGYLTDGEIDSGIVESIKETQQGLALGGMPATRDDGRQEMAFEVGDRVRARNVEIRGHTRLVRYVRGKIGVIVRRHGTHAFPDTAAHDQGENPQPLYGVRFEARELWGDNVERKDCVHIDLWEDYLEPAERN
jgi:nitrile hydratase